MRLKLIGRGKTAHGARPWLGENAIENLIADYFKIKRHFELTAPGHWHRTLNFSRIQAGKAVNQVPDYAEALFDIRFTENDDMEAVVDGHPPRNQGRGRGGRARAPLPGRRHAPTSTGCSPSPATPNSAPNTARAMRASSPPSASPASSGARTATTAPMRSTSTSTSTACSRCTASWIEFLTGLL